MSLAEQLKFLCQYVLKPTVVGAVAPSSPSLARKMVEWIDWNEVRAVVEYGPGTGAFTRRILSEIRPGTRFFAIEVNGHFVDVLRRRYPEIRVYRESVAHVQALCEREGIDQVDAIISGLPWASFKEQDQAKFLGTMMEVLPPGGHFATFAYLQGLLLPAGRRFRRTLPRYFSRVQQSKVAWINLPPAFVYRCRR